MGAIRFASPLSGLFGISVDAGRIALPSTLADLGIDDCAPGLTGQERQATVEQLLMSRSGVYHWANYGSGRWSNGVVYCS